MSKLKVGDRVVVVKDVLGRGYWLLRRGQITAEYEEEHLDFRVLFEDGATARFTPDELELESVYDALSKKPVETRVVGDLHVPEDFKPDFSTLLPLDEPKVALRDDDVVSHPSHYTSHPSGVECKDIIGHYPTFIGNAIKYLWRAGLKDGNPPIQDLRKAIKNIEFEIERLGGTV